MEQEIDRQVGASIAVMQTLHRSVVVRQRLGNSDIWEILKVESLLLYVKRSQLMRFYLLDTSVGRCFKYDHSERGPMAEQSEAGLIISLSCSENDYIPQTSWWVEGGWSGPLDLNPDRRIWMDG